MQHLSEETLARLVDEAPDDAEHLHLDVCDPCRTELEALRRQTGMLAMMPELAAPRREWAEVAARLEAEELIGRRRIDGWTESWVFRAAAAAALFLGGTVTGALALRDGPSAAPASVSTARPASAEVELRAAEAAYLAALTRYSEATGASQAMDPLNRLAALEGIVLTTRAALEEAPADPVINGYHLSALGQRDAILKQIEQTDEEPWY